MMQPSFHPRAFRCSVLLSPGLLALRRRNRTRVLVAALVVLLLLLSLRLEAAQAGSSPKTLRVGFLQRVFYESDLRDVKAAMEVHIRQISDSMGLENPSSVVMFADTSSMTSALRSGDLEMVTMPTIEFLRIRDRVPLIPFFVSANNNGQGSRYVIIAHANSSINSISDLKNRTILLPPIAKHDLGHLWLETLLMKAGKGGRAGFFRQVKESPKISHAIMGVFLRQADAAIVTRAGLDINRQLNPQLNSRLIVLAESRNLSDGITCLVPSTPEPFRINLTKTILRLNGTKSGQQLFTMFQSSGVMTFKPSQLEGLEELLREHEQLKSKSSKRK
jgi:ABC-type phosphate/phosphonate transport system substrate-binding protein